MAQQKTTLPLIVVAADGPSLIGRDWLQAIRLDWKAIWQVKCHQLSDILHRHEAVFQPGLGTLEGYEAKIHVSPDAQLRFCKARPVPYAMRAKVEEELEVAAREYYRTYPIRRLGVTDSASSQEQWKICEDLWGF